MLHQITTCGTRYQPLPGLIGNDKRAGFRFELASILFNRLTEMILSGLRETMKAKLVKPCVFAISVLLTIQETVSAGVIINTSANILLANSQVESGGDTSANPNVVNGSVGSLLSYTATSQHGFFSNLYGPANLSNGDIGAGVVSTGYYAIALENGAGTGGRLMLTFAGVKRVDSLAIYNGYGNRDDGTYFIQDAASTLHGSYTISGTGGVTNNGVDSVWVKFKSAIETSALVIDFDITTSDLNTSSFREIQVFGSDATPVPEPTTFVLTAASMLGMIRYQFRRRRMADK